MKKDRRYSRQAKPLLTSDYGSMRVYPSTWGWPFWSIFNVDGVCMFQGKVKPAALPALIEWFLHKRHEPQSDGR